MKVLHTADWHVGKKLGRIDRADETLAVLDEIVAIARAREVDLVVVAGDLFDRGVPPLVSLRVVLQTLVSLAASGAHVVAIPGNHDSGDLFDVLRPYLEPSRVTLVHKPLPADAGGVVEVSSRDGREVARVACFPFLHQAHVVEFVESQEDRYKSYAERVRAINRHYADHLAARPKREAIDILVGHFMIHNAIPSGSERALHIGEAYMATEDAVPHQFHYVALGHIHQAQPAPGSEDYARYSGSVMQLDFGEVDQDKSVIVADLSPDGRRHIEAVPLSQGRRLKKVRGTLDELRERAADLQGAILSVEVVTEVASASLADEVHEFLPDALYVRVANPQRTENAPRREGRTLHELYAEYHAAAHGEEPTPGLVAALDELIEQVGVDL